jgi:Glycosyl hydrolase family 12
MIWVDNHGQVPAGSKVATANIGGTSYGVWSAGSSPVSLVLNSNESSGTIDVLAALNWLKSNGYEPSNLAVNQIDFGWEICSTGGSAQTFKMNSFGIKSS